MSLPRFAVSIFNSRTKDLVLETGYYENEVVAGYITCFNNFGIDFEDNPEREDFSVEDMQLEFKDYGLYVEVVEV